MNIIKEVGREDKVMHAQASPVRGGARSCLLRGRLWASIYIDAKDCL